MNVPKYKFSFEHEREVNSAFGFSIVETYYPFEFKIKTLPFLPSTIKNPMISEATASMSFYFRLSFLTVLRIPASHSHILIDCSSTVANLRKEPSYAVLRNQESLLTN